MRALDRSRRFIGAERRQRDGEQRRA